MKPVIGRQLWTVVLGVLGSALAGGGQAWAATHMRALETPLDRYVASPDPSYRWKLVRQANVEGIRVSYIELVSQTWLTPAEVDRPRWWHWLVVYTPQEVKHPVGLLMIAGGSNKDHDLPKPSPQLGRLAAINHAVVAELRMVPNQPLIFEGDGQERYEDDLIAYTWDKFLRTGDERWPARLPMTKAAVRAMDTLTAFCASKKGGGVQIARFMVAGGSKRGWTTWTTAAVDRRVVAITPIVIDMLNLVPSFKHHYRAYGFYAPAVGDYVRHGIMEWMDTPEFRRLLRIVEPYEYRQRLTMPKLLINACGDQFFLPDSAQFYWADLRGPKYLRYVPNADHSLRDTDARETLAAWQHAVLNRTPLPELVWKRDAQGVIHVQASGRPQAVKFWTATNPEARDFRLETLGPVWQSRDLEPGPRGLYTARLAPPPKGWRAGMIELTYDLGGPTPLKLTTRVWVAPDRLPFPPPRGKSAAELKAATH